MDAGHRIGLTKANEITGSKAESFLTMSVLNKQHFYGVCVEMLFSIIFSGYIYAICVPRTEPAEYLWRGFRMFSLS